MQTSISVLDVFLILPNAMPCFYRKATFGKNWAESWDLEVNSPEDVSADHPTPNHLKATKFLYFTFITECIYDYLKKNTRVVL